MNVADARAGTRPSFFDRHREVKTSGIHVLLSNDINYSQYSLKRNTKPRDDDPPVVKDS